MLHAAAAAKLSNDLKLKECPAFVGSLSRQSKGPKLLCFTDSDIPLTFAGFGEKKQVTVGLVVVDCLMDGYTKIPIEFTKAGKYQQGPNPTPLSERKPWPEDPTGSTSMMICRPYGIVEGCPKDKAVPKEDGYGWEVHPGMVLRASFWADAARGTPIASKFHERLCPPGMDVIPAFSLLEVEVVCRGWSRWNEGDVNPDSGKPREICPVKKGYGMAIDALKVFEHASPYSVLDKLGRVLPSTLDAVKGKQQLWQQKFPSINNLLQQDKVSFFVRTANLSTGVDLDERPEIVKSEPAQIRLTNWCPESVSTNSCPESIHPIDILHTDAMAATNCPDIQSACALIEMAANAGALSLLVCCNEYRQGRERAKSMLYGFPMVDTRILLDAIKVPIDPETVETDETDNYFMFRTGFEMLLPSGTPAQQPKKGNGGGDGDDDDDSNGDEEGPATQLEGVDADGGEESTSMQAPLLLVSKEPFSCVRGEYMLKTPDFMLVGNSVQLHKGYYVRFVHPVLQSKCILWGGYINLSKPQITMPGLEYNILAGAASAAASAVGGAGRKRSRWGVSSGAAFDPFGNNGGSSGANGGSSTAGGKAALSAREGKGGDDEHDDDEGVEEEEEATSKHCSGGDGEEEGEEGSAPPAASRHAKSSKKHHDAKKKGSAASSSSSDSRKKGK